MGTWISEDGNTTLEFTSETFYQRIVYEDGVLENYADILEYNIELGHIKISYTALLFDGDQLGFDSPVWYMTFQVNADILQIAILSQDFPDSVDPELYFRQ